MNILALEASSDCALVAATLEEKLEICSTLRLDEPRALARELAIYADRVLKNAGWTFDDVRGLAVGLGPGSWTSLRIALSTWKTLALACEISLVGVPTYDAIALAVHQKVAADTSTQKFLLAVTGRCRPGEIYGKLFVCEEGIEAVTDEETVVPAEYAQRILDIAASQSLPVVVTGDGSEPLQNELQHRSAEWQNVSVAIEDIAVCIAQLGAEKLHNNSTSPLELLPLYVAASSAERVAAERAARQNT